MGVSDVLARLAVRQAHVLVVEAVGHWLTRVAVERLTSARGWHLAVSPADADILAVCGSTGPELTRALASLWDQFPGPRARIDVASPDRAAAALEHAEAALRSTVRQQADSSARAGHGTDDGDRPPARHDDHPAAPHGDHPAASHGDHPAASHGDHPAAPHGDHPAAQHAGTDTGAAQSPPGGGIALAHGGEDRDGLEMDVLHVRLGPVLPAWPTGLVLRCHLHGDVIGEAQACVVDAAQRGHAAGGHRTSKAGPDAGEFAARRCDNVARVLALAGWSDAAGRARVVRDLLLADKRSAAATELERLRRQLRRSRLLRLSLRRVGPLGPGELTRLRLAPELAGDVWDRLDGMLDRADRAVSGGTGAVTALPVTPPEAVASVVSGWDVATARLIVASLDIDVLGAVSDG
ncbi:hypothetical protein [Salinispora arenicola]|uniref:hypothetical protein n=1 Tax=Salinispora arenicola TaxID=168697 RepID=UPI0016971333|nr:hypothetical protein [Salinispora arenicola]NIL57339.1 hypothetical protein [Salinispora arenicola]NIL61982.1 hypothetical protein [Salinispora arenicola]